MVIYCISNRLDPEVSSLQSQLSDPQTHHPTYWIQRNDQGMVRRAMDQPLSLPDLLPADEHEKGKQRAQPREHTRANYGGVKASVSGQGRGVSGISDIQLVWSQGGMSLRS